MARFANECMKDMKRVTKDLEPTLGSSTGELMLRVGIHSGSVIAGVLRGERQRFQLYGDTMNTAARMESTSQPGRIQVSEETARLLVEANRGSWIEKREDEVIAKGKGLLKTYWLTLPMTTMSSRGSSSIRNSFGSNTARSTDTQSISSDDSAGSNRVPVVDERTKKLIDWNTSMLENFMKKIIAQRRAAGVKAKPLTASRYPTEARTPREEVVRIIGFPKYSKPVEEEDSKFLETVQVPKSVVAQLRSFVTAIAQMYQPHPFHNFDKTSHTVTAVVKLLSRVDLGNGFDDPLIQFAMAFSALVCDAGHTGVPNSVLVEENKLLGSEYNNQSVAEQYSFDETWKLFMNGRYDSLRGVLFKNESEVTLFRQVVINAVMATDKTDDVHQAHRDNRWRQAFMLPYRRTEEEVASRKATALVETLIQAADAAYTMQDWKIYQKWNQRLFEEKYHAYQNGRFGKNDGKVNPAEYWYEDQLQFFDSFVIPLAEKLRDGLELSDSDEFLDYAILNRDQWQDDGEELVREMAETLENRK